MKMGRLLLVVSGGFFLQMATAGEAPAKKILTQEISAETPEYVLHKSLLRYYFTFMGKTIKAPTEKAKGKGACGPDTCRFLIAAPVSSFKSGNTNRDLNMLEATRAKEHPMVKLEGKYALSSLSDSARITARISFAGKSNDLIIPAHYQDRDGRIRFKGSFTILLSDFDIERPSLLLFKIPDAVHIDFDTVWDPETS